MNRGEKTARALEARRKSWEAMPAEAKAGTRRPGSRNPKKGATGKSNKR